jgi:hypothetical protein
MYFLGRAGHSSVVLSDGSVLVMGGWTSGYVESKEVWKSSDKGVNWVLLTTAPFICKF